MVNKEMDRLTSDEFQMLIDETPHCDSSVRPKNIEPTMVYQNVEQLKLNYPETEEETKLKPGEPSGESK